MKIALSFEDKVIKLIKATAKKNHLYVHEATTIKKDALSEFLKKTTADEFHVVYNFHFSFHKILNIPAVKKKYKYRLIENKLKAEEEIPESFYFSYKDIPMVKDSVSIIGASMNEINNIIGIFEKAGKNITSIHTPIGASLSLIPSAKEDMLVIVSSGISVYIAALRQGHILYLRRMDVYQPEHWDIDIKTIEMTVSFLRQRLSFIPSQCYVIGAFSKDISMFESIGLETLLFNSALYVSNISADDAQNFHLPIGCLLSDRSYNLVPRELRARKPLKNYLQFLYTGASLLSISVILGFYGLNTFKNVRELQNEMSFLRKEISPVISSFRSRPATKHIDMNISSFFASLSHVVPEEVEIKRVSSNLKQGSCEIVIEGKVVENKTAYGIYGKFLEDIKAIPNTHVMEHSITPDTAGIGFKIKAGYAQKN